MKHWLLGGCAALLVCLPTLAEEKVGKSIFDGPPEQRIDALAEIQPGLGVVMNEIGTRFANLYWAANGGNWGLADYQLKELLEAQEVGEATRPGRAPMLKALEENYLVPLQAAINKKDLSQFNPRFAEAERGCNACHTALGYGFIHYHVPRNPPSGWLDFKLKTSPGYKEKTETQ
ncbi:hypothetical protein NH8B_2472 [Pseudogulbenkiania sp. NH8B]|uniref:hypothetical protein n=1 Tax=Pseudogulbenkiania sp. (strain NH8B) TaxID=748280 RepID=UPI00022798F4|nr:hypothetical protein [Pseudogulbenkiania sp. NH8B]BAK77286.1 hypothetical protein NH8B_2472 [Pseudogulbenkiania sp. NH8B]